jgi:hypothetical protein
MKTITELQELADKIDNLIKTTINSSNSETFPILDGIIDINKYFNCKFKILWILKEPYDEFDENGEPCGGGWRTADAINPKTTIKDFTGGRPTFEPMIYTIWGILNEFNLWENMDSVEDDPTMIDALKSIAYINVKKLPGHTTSPESIIENAYSSSKEILLKQITDYNPDIIIGGSTLHHFFNDLGFKREEMVKHESLNYIIKENKIYIDAYHPAQRTNSTGVTKQQYCNDIINAVKVWVSTKN